MAQIRPELMKELRECIQVRLASEEREESVCKLMKGALGTILGTAVVALALDISCLGKLRILHRLAQICGPEGGVAQLPVTEEGSVDITVTCNTAGRVAVVARLYKLEESITEVQAAEFEATLASVTTASEQARGASAQE